MVVTTETGKRISFNMELVAKKSEKDFLDMSKDSGATDEQLKQVYAAAKAPKDKK